MIRAESISENKFRSHRNIRVEPKDALRVSRAASRNGGLYLYAVWIVSCVPTMSRRNAPNIRERTGTWTDERKLSRRGLEGRGRPIGGSARQAYEGRDDKW